MVYPRQLTGAFPFTSLLPAAQVVSSSLLLAVGIGLVATVLGVLSTGPFATLSGLTGTVHSDSVIYMRVYCCLRLATAVMLVLGAGLRSAGDTHTPFMIGAVSNIVNVFLLYAFLGSGWSFPDLGIVGAALAGGTMEGVSESLAGRVAVLELQLHAHQLDPRRLYAE